MWLQSAAAAYTSNISSCSRKDTSREQSLVNMNIFVGLKDLHAEVPGLTYPIIHIQSIKMAKVRIAVQTYHKVYDPKCFLFHKRHAENVYLSVVIILIINKMRTIFKPTRIRDKQFLYENMIIVYVVSN